MNKLFIIVLSALLVFGISQARAEQSPSSATGSSYLDNQVYTVAYNNSGATIQSYAVVVLDTSATEKTTLGAYITTSTTADDYRVFGVTAGGETCASGTNCRVIIRGPARVLDTDATHAVAAILAASGTTAQATTYSTSDGTAGGYLGHVIGATSDLGPNYCWVWVNPQIHK